MAYEYFISYRREKGGISQAREIRQILVKCVGEDKVFRDLESIEPGIAFPKQIKKAIAEAKHFILLINEAFFKEDECPDDWFFKEIRDALANPEMDITPIIYDKAFSFDDKRLPEDFQKLKYVPRLVYSKDNATHFDIFVRDHFGIKGYDGLLKSLFPQSFNVNINVDHSGDTTNTENNVNSKNTNTMNNTTYNTSNNADKVIKGDLYYKSQHVDENNGTISNSWQ